ncbi:MAG: MATE family efflux transporter [Clostridia bacterium]
METATLYPLTRRQAIRKVVVLAIPAIFENIMITLVNIVDTAMVGYLGPSATAAAALNASPIWFINAMSMAVSGGVTVLIAHSWGAEEYKTAGDYARQSLVLCILLGLFFTVVAQFIAPHYPHWMNAEADVVSDATAYMRIISYAIIPNFVGLTLYGVVRGSGDTRTPMVVSILANLLNVVGNFLLIYPSRVLPVFGGIFMWGAGLGVRGAAISTAFATGLTGVVMLGLLFSRKDALRFSVRCSYRLKKQCVKSILRIGVPIAGERGIINIGQILYVAVISSLGTISLSAHHLATTAEGICYNPAYGFSAAAIIMVGQALGAHDEHAAQRFARINICMCVAVMIVVSALMYLFSVPLIGLFSPDPAVCAQGSAVLRIIAFAEPMFAISIVTSGVLRGAGDTVAPLLIGMLCMLCVRLPLSVLFVSKLGLGLSGAWYAMGIDLCLRGLLTLLRFRSGKWKAHSRRLSQAER